MAERRCSAHAGVEQRNGGTLSARKPRDPLSSSSSSSDCCAGQRSTPHSRTLEVRPGRITRKLGLRYDCDCERDETKSLLGVLMLGRDILIANDEWLIKINGRSVRLSVCLSACPRLQEVGVLVYGSCMMLVRNYVDVGQGWGQVQLVKYSNTSSTRNQVQVQVQVLCIFTNQVLKYIKY